MSETNGQWMSGLTVRDYFAAHAVGGLLSTTLAESLLHNIKYDESDPQQVTSAAMAVQWHLARMAYESADAMLAVRSGQGPPDVQTKPC